MIVISLDFLTTDSRGQNKAITQPDTDSETAREATHQTQGLSSLSSSEKFTPDFYQIFTRKLNL